MKIEIVVQQDNKEYRLFFHEPDAGGWVLWLQNQDDEGMSIAEADLFEILDKHFKEHF